MEIVQILSRINRIPLRQSGVTREKWPRPAIQAAPVRALDSHSSLAAHVLKQDQQAPAPLVGLIYELVKAGQNIDRAALGA